MAAQRVIVTRHAFKRHRQRVGNLPHRILLARLNTAYICGLYREGPDMIRLCGVWWGCVHRPEGLLLTTCLGRSDAMPKPERRRAHAD